MRRLWYNTWHFNSRIDGRHDVLSYLRWMREVM